VAAARGLPWLDALGSHRLAQLVKLLRYNDESESQRKSALRLGHILDIIATLDLSKPADLLKGTMLMVGHDALLRGGELTSEIRARHITWWPRTEGYSLFLRRTKTVRAGPGVQIQVPDVASPHSSVKLLRRWWLLRGLDRTPDAFVFPAIVRGRIVASQAASTAQLRHIIKELVAAIGLDASKFSAHSLRAGGATDLFAAHVPYPIIKKMGRWASEAAMLYFRSEDEVWAAVGAAFSALATAHAAKSL
jgi:hypothetical protein